jgi:ubiquinone/menaquinone biosynthesis C-methylase UbiE
MNEAEKRARMPTGAHAVLARRTVANANKNLLDLVTQGQSVIDVGCGSGEITKGIAKLVGESGFVMGIDTSEHLIGLAQQNFSTIKNLTFDVADINSYSAERKYDVVTSARVLQWLSNREEVLIRMKNLLKEGGCITILDYNHEKIEFDPELPRSMKKLYEAFLKWRADSGMDNQVADHLEEQFARIGLKNMVVEDRSEESTAGTPSFLDEISIWQKVAETRGIQLVQDHYITEEDRQLAIQEYNDWMVNDATKMKLYLRSVTGYK